jgi:hypothetical protein
MSWPKDPFITDSAYKTPLPCQPCERQVWRAVAALYVYDTLASLMKINNTEAERLTSPQSPLMPGSRMTAAPASYGGGSSSSTPRSAIARAEAVERRSAFLAAAAPASAMSARYSSNSTASSCTVSPLSAQMIKRSFPDSPGAIAVEAEAEMAGVPVSPPPPVLTVPPSTSAYAVKGVAGSWSTSNSNNKRIDSNGSMSGTTAYIRATSLRALEPLQSLLMELAEKQLVLGGGVVDVAVQHPLPCLRVELVRLLLTYPFWDWSMCAPVAVAAGTGDVDLLPLLMEVKELDPNAGFPLTVAVRRRQEAEVLPFLLSHHRIRPNYGGAFYAAVVLGNVPAMHLLGDAADVNVNRFASNEGTSALLYALRQYLICRRWELQQVQLEPPSATPLLHAMKAHQGSTSPTRIGSDALKRGNDEATTATPLMVARPDSSSPKETTRNTGAAAAREAGSVDWTTRHPPSPSALSPPATPAGGPHDSVLLGSRSPGAGADTDEEKEESAAAATASSGFDRDTVSHSGDSTHISAFRKDTQEHPLRTTRHWLEVLLYLLDHPAIEVNAGFYMTPLQICVLAGDVEVVGWLLQHPHLRPSHIPKATTALRNSYYLLQHHTLSQRMMQCVVATPVEMAVQLRHFEIFRDLVRDRRVQVPVRLTIDLERIAADGAAVAFLTILAQYRDEWESWGWRWRRRCLLVSTAATTIFAVCFWTMVLVWSDTLQAALLVLTVTYAVCAALSVASYLWEVRKLRNATEASFTQGSATLLALVRHLCPSWSAQQQCAAVVVLLVCPGLVPLLDLLCAWCIYMVHRSRRPLEAAVCDTSPHAVAPAAAAAASATRSTHQSSTVQQQHGRPLRNPRLPPEGERPLEMERPSSTVSSRWSAGVLSCVEHSANGSFPEASPGLSTGGRGGGVGSEGFSRSRPAAARTRRQSGANRTSTGAAHNVQGTESCDASLTSPQTSGVQQHSFVAASSASRNTNSMASPSTCATRSSGPWVVPGRPSRYLLTTEYHAPDLLLRALAYSAFDTVLTLPRLLACVVGIFMFLYMAFPSAAPSSSHSSNSVQTPGTTVAADVLRSRSVFTLYYSVKLSSPVMLVRPTAYNISGELSMADVAAAAASSAATPAYTIGIGVVGCLGLLSSMIGGTALLGMMGSLRCVTVQAFFVSSGHRAEAKAGVEGAAEGRVGGDAEWQVIRHRERAEQPEYLM